LAEDALKYEKYLKTLPIIPEVARKIMGMAEEKLDISFKQLEDIIKVDPGLTAKILKVANSALYARQREITSLQMAITLLGFKNIKSLVLLVTASNVFLKLKRVALYGRFWRHSLYTAFLARHVAARSGQKELSDDVFVAGILHDIGQVALLNSDQSGYELLVQESDRDAVPLDELENRAFGIDHKELGASLLERWFFPRLLVDVAREHGNLTISSSHKNAIIVVAVADLLSEIWGFGYGTPDREERLSSLLPHSGLDNDDLNYYNSQGQGDLQQDPLFLEYQEILGLR
jgi:putative nucleotidyltransferase with HDIG domain